MTQQTKSQRLITEWHDAWLKPINPTKYARAGGKMAEELHRLEAANAELVGVMKAFSGYVLDEQNTTDGAVTYSTTAINHWAFLARAALKKHGGAA